MDCQLNQAEIALTTDFCERCIEITHPQTEG